MPKHPYIDFKLPFVAHLDKYLLLFVEGLVYSGKLELRSGVFILNKAFKNKNLKTCLLMTWDAQYEMEVAFGLTLPMHTT